jgi:hypothetical protein
LIFKISFGGMLLLRRACIIIKAACVESALPACRFCMIFITKNFTPSRYLIFFSLTAASLARR